MTVWSHFTSDTMDQPAVILHNQRTILTDLSFKSFSYETKTDLLEWYMCFSEKLPELHKCVYASFMNKAEKVLL